MKVITVKLAESRVESEAESEVESEAESEAERIYSFNIKLDINNSDIDK